MARVQVLPAEESGGSAPNAEIHIERWTGEEKILRVTSHERCELGLRLLDYPAWLVAVNGKAVRPQHAETKRRDDSDAPPGTWRITCGLCRRRIEL